MRNSFRRSVRAETSARDIDFEQRKADIKHRTSLIEDYREKNAVYLSTLSSLSEASFRIRIDRRDPLTVCLAFAAMRDVNDLNGCMSRSILVSTKRTDQKASERLTIGLLFSRMMAIDGKTMMAAVAAATTTTGILVCHRRGKEKCLLVGSFTSR